MNEFLVACGHEISLAISSYSPFISHTFKSLQQVYNGSFKGNYGVYSGILGSEWDKYGMEVSVWLLSWII